MACRLTATTDPPVRPAVYSFGRIESVPVGIGLGSWGHEHVSTGDAVRGSVVPLTDFSGDYCNNRA